MATNARKQNKHTKFKLLVDDREYGCFEDDAKARLIGRCMIGQMKAYSYKVYDGDRLVDSSD